MPFDDDHLKSQSIFVQGIDHIDSIHNSKTGEYKGYDIHMKNSDKMLSFHPEDSHGGPHAESDHWHMTDLNGSWERKTTKD